LLKRFIDYFYKLTVSEALLISVLFLFALIIVSGGLFFANRRNLRQMESLISHLHTAVEEEVFENERLAEEVREARELYYYTIGVRQAYVSSRIEEQREAHRQRLEELHATLAILESQLNDLLSEDDESEEAED